jgi:hypothetical protein
MDGPTKLPVREKAIKEIISTYLPDSVVMEKKVTITF